MGLSVAEFRKMIDSGEIKLGKNGYQSVKLTPEYREHLKKSREQRAQEALKQNINTERCYIMQVDPIGKPRMTKASARFRGKKYFVFKDEVKRQAEILSMPPIPNTIESLIFFIPMPESWSKKKKEQLCGTLHEQKPDIDNLTKSLFDALCDEDSHIALIKGPLTKIWADEGKIAISY